MSKTPTAHLAVYSRLLRYIIPHRRFFLISIVGFLLYSSTQPLFANLIKHIIDTLPKPLDSPVYLSLITAAEATSPKAWKASLRSVSD